VEELFQTAEELFRDDLLKDEKVLWMGQPETSVIFSRADFYLIPFSLVWCGFCLFWEIGALRSSNIVVTLFGIPFLAIGAYLLFGRFIYKYWKKTHTYYAVTSERVLILTTLWRRHLQTKYISAISEISKSIRSDGIGTLWFGPSGSNSGAENTGLGSPLPVAPAFYDIMDADKVHEMVSQLLEP
jgi:hypothetical protein